MMNEYLNPQIDVIVPTADKTEWPCFDSLLHNERVSKKYPGVRFIVIESSGPSWSFSRSVNQGIRLSRENADIFLLNDDCFMDTGWVMAFQSAKTCHPASGIFGGLLSFPSIAPSDLTGNPFSGRKAMNHLLPKYQHAGGFIPLTRREQISAIVRFAFWNQSPFWVLRQMRAAIDQGFRFPGHYHDLSPRRDIHLVTAAAMLITRRTINELGTFDESYPLGFEDTDYCLRALEHGMTPVLVSDGTGVHHESLTTRKLEDRKRQSFQIFCQRWPPERIRAAIEFNHGIVHPKYCGCDWWME